MPKKGEILRTTFENFEVIAQIKSGGAGEVYRAKNSSGEPVAIKVLKFDPDSTKRKRFQREIRFCSQDVHPNIIRILGDGLYVDASGIRLARNNQVNVRVVPIITAIEESVELAHDIFCRVYRKMPKAMERVH